MLLVVVLYINFLLAAIPGQQAGRSASLDAVRDGLCC